MSRQITRKWRPPLILVLGGTLIAVLTAASVGLFAPQYLSNFIGPRRSLILAIGVALALSCVLGFLLWRLILRPINALARRADAIAMGEASAREPLDHYGTPELRKLGQSVMEMAEALHNRESTIRNYTAHVTHELKTPLTAIHGAAELLDEMPDRDTDDRKLIATILESSKRMQHLLLAAQDIAAAREPAHAGSTTLETVLPNLRLRFPEIEILATGENIAIPLGSEGLEIVLHHLIENSIEHRAKIINLDTNSQSGSQRLTVRDDGEGISHGNRDRVFAPFFTTKRAIGGTGMGLSIVQSLIRTHRGDIFLEDQRPGALFAIEF